MVARLPRTRNLPLQPRRTRNPPPYRRLTDSRALKSCLSRTILRLGTAAATLGARRWPRGRASRAKIGVIAPVLSLVLFYFPRLAARCIELHGMPASWGTRVPRSPKRPGSPEGATRATDTAFVARQTWQRVASCTAATWNHEKYPREGSNL